MPKFWKMDELMHGNEAIANQWISVNEQLPVSRVWVLVAYKNGVTIAQRDGYLVSPRETHTYWRGVKGAKHQLASVTHWMPLPAPPGGSRYA